MALSTGRMLYSGPYTLMLGISKTHLHLNIIAPSLLVLSEHSPIHNSDYEVDKDPQCRLIVEKEIVSIIEDIV